MLSVSLLFGLVVGLIVPGSCCQEKEYKSRDGDCCSKCDEGQFVLKDCTDVRSTRCNRCKDGTFMNQPNGLNMCFPCTSCVSGNGLFVKQACTASTDTVCDVLSGYMCRDESSSTGCSRAEKHSSCVSGQQIKEPGTRDTNTVCEDCPNGYFSKDGVKCLTWKTCPEPHTVVTRGDSRNDVGCSKLFRNRGWSCHDSLYLPLVIFVSQSFF
ncbi:tumor necrosis factor receptor superfamily member 14-like isoform X1 [Solea solea]|uniref:tumor necrosis factor receptor superfamily member 14-like isoform X1 n=1 Tax=Solea solea TaxID=90069 RepID=UPI00272A3F1B|nr:tumor necrosis factor receptor superfamily member 14-like isoform X1 [Solea solea]